MTVGTSYQPGMPLGESGSEPEEDGTFLAQVTIEHANETDLTVSFRSAAPVAVDEDATAILAGTTAVVPPATLEIEGERALTDTDTLAAAGRTGEYPFQRYAVAIEDEVDDSGIELAWSGRTTPRNEIQLYGWDATQGAWLLLAANEPSADGQLTLIGQVLPSMVVNGVAQVLVLDGPRTAGGLFSEVSVTDGAFADPGDYDFSINHMTDTQFYSEGFRRVFTDMASWVVANAEGRKISYNSLTGDIIENWVAGNSDQERARREFEAAALIVSIMNDADVANGVLPGNHDNLWGRNNDLYNEFFPASMFEGKAWWGGEWREGDNSAHDDYFAHDGTDFLVINLPYMPSPEQMAWASALASANPEHNVILATHSYLHTSGAVETREENRYTARGIEIWEQVVAPNDNVFLVLGGHYHGVATNYADPVTGERVDATEVGADTVVFDNVGATGRRVVEMLADYQGYRSTQPDARADTFDRASGSSVCSSSTWTPGSWPSTPTRRPSTRSTPGSTTNRPSVATMRATTAVTTSSWCSWRSPATPRSRRPPGRCRGPPARTSSSSPRPARSPSTASPPRTRGGCGTPWSRMGRRSP